MSCETIAVIHGCHRREKIRLLWNWSFLFLLSHSALLSLFLCCILMAQVVVFKEEIIPIPEIAEYYSLQGTLCSFFSHFFLSSILLYNDTINIFTLLIFYDLISLLFWFILLCRAGGGGAAVQLEHEREHAGRLHQLPGAAGLRGHWDCHGACQGLWVRLRYPCTVCFVLLAECLKIGGCWMLVGWWRMLCWVRCRESLSSC